MHAPLKFISALAIVALAAACSYPFSPPATAVHYDAPRILEKGESAIRGGLSLNEEVFGSAIIAGDVTYRRGLHERVELSATASAYGVVGEDNIHDHHRGIYSARVAPRFKLHDHISAHAGLGGGFSPAAGAFVSPEVGLSLGYENAFLVPFASARFYTSHPIAPKSIRIDTEDQTSPEFWSAGLTYGPAVFLGLKVPLGDWPEKKLRRRYNLTTGFGGTWAFEPSKRAHLGDDSSSRATAAFINAIAAFEILF